MRRGLRLGVGLPWIAAAIAVLMTGEAMARGEDKSWEAGAYTFFSRQTNESGIDEDIGFGVRGAWYLRAAHAFELTVDNIGPDHADVDGLEFDVTRIAVNYVHNYAPKGNTRLSPYLTFGTGVLTAELTGGGGSAEDRSTIIQVGGGVRYFYNERVGLRVDGRASRWHGEGEATPLHGYFTFDVTVGITFLWKGGT
jgi:hypothetical protein